MKSSQIPVSSSQFQTVAVDVRRLWKGSLKLEDSSLKKPEVSLVTSSATSRG